MAEIRKMPPLARICNPCQHKNKEIEMKRNTIKHEKTNALKGQQSIAQGNALCSKAPHLNQALKGRNQEDVALAGL